MALPNKAKIPVGTVLAGKYRITREIGRGGMAAVYEAANVDIGKRVAIKVLAQELTASAVVVERFLREARAAAAIRSPYICDIYDSGKLDDGRPFLVLELLEGESLYERMTKIRWLDIETTVAIVSQTCRGLTKAHAAQIVHRDLKPENIFLTKDEEGKLLSKILDFGLAKFYTSMEGGPQARLTREGAVFGTPAYMSPEQVRGQGAVDHRADLWALGCIVYECFTGRTVWSTEQGVAMTFAQIANAPLPQPSQYRPDLPVEFSAWFNKALDRDITKRFQTAKEFADTFARVFNQERPSHEISSIGPSPVSGLNLQGGQLSDPGANPFLMSAPSVPSVKVVPPTRQVAPDATTEPPPQRNSGPAGNASVPGAPSVPVELLSGPQSQSGAPSAGPPSPRPSKLGFAGPDASVATPRSNPARRAAIVAGLVVVSGGIAFAAWTQLGDRTTTVPAGSASASSSAVPSATAPTDASGTASARPPVIAESPLPPWMASVREGQAAIANGDLKLAQKLMKEAFDKGAGHGVPRTMLEHLSVASAASTGGATDKSACKLTGLARPRTFDLGMPASARPVGAGRPSITVGPRGPVITWNDAHENGDHAYTVVLDDAMRDVGTPIDVTPEAVSVARPELRRAGDKLVLLYGDHKGPEAGVHARFLDQDGRIAGAAVQISPAKAGSYYPSIAAAPDGSYFVSWSDESGDSEDLFFRHLGADLAPAGDLLRATDLVPAGPSKPRARVASLAVAGDALLATYRLERDPARLIYHMRVPLADAGKGLEPLKKGDRKVDRTIGEVALVNTDKGKADGPILACGSAGCFIVWHGEQNGGASAAYVDPTKTQPLSRRKFAKTGSHPSVAVSASGQAQVVWYEGGKVMTAPITRDGFGTPSRIARISGEQPPASIVAGNKPGEWYLAWLDYETGHLEAYAARVQCK